MGKDACVKKKPPRRVVLSKLWLVCTTVSTMKIQQCGHPPLPTKKTYFSCFVCLFYRSCVLIIASYPAYTEQLGKTRTRKDFLEGWIIEGSDYQPGLLDILKASRTPEVMIRFTNRAITLTIHLPPHSCMRVYVCVVSGIIRWKVESRPESPEKEKKNLNTSHGCASCPSFLP